MTKSILWGVLVALNNTCSWYLFDTFFYWDPDTLPNACCLDFNPLMLNASGLNSNTSHLQWNTILKYIYICQYFTIFFEVVGHSFRVPYGLLLHVDVWLGLLHCPILIRFARHFEPLCPPGFIIGSFETLLPVSKMLPETEICWSRSDDNSMQRGMVLVWICQGGPFHLMVYMVHKRR